MDPPYFWGNRGWAQGPPFLPGGPRMLFRPSSSSQGSQLNSSKNPNTRPALKSPEGAHTLWPRGHPPGNSLSGKRGTEVTGQSP